MKTVKIFGVMALMIGAATYTCAIEGASTATAPGQNMAMPTKVDNLSLDALVLKVKTTKDIQGNRQYIDALYRFKPKSEKDISTLVDLAVADTGKSAVGEGAIHAVENVDFDNKALAPVFVKLLGHQTPRVKLAAITVVARTKDKNAVPNLIKRLDDSEYISNRAGLALAEIGDESAIPELLKHIGKPGGHAVALAKFGAPALRAIVDKISDATKTDRTRMTQTIGLFHDPQSQPILKGLLKNKDKHVRMNAVQSLGNLHDAGAIEAIKDEEPLVRLYAIEALRKVESPEAVSSLIEVLVHDSNSEARVLAADVLGEKKSTNAIKYLQEAANDKDGEVRTAAGISLRKMGVIEEGNANER